MRFLVAAGAIAVLMSTPAPLDAKEKKLSGLELQQVQSRDFESGYDDVFPSVITVLQDAGYRIQQADKASGLITGSASTKSGMTWALIGGIGKSKKTPIVSAFVEQRGKVTRVRLNFVMAKTKSHLYGMSSADEEPITRPEVYRDAFEKIDKALFVRQAMDGPAQAQPAQTAAQ
jgi:hypothetical protein